MRCAAAVKNKTVTIPRRGPAAAIAAGRARLLFLFLSSDDDKTDDDGIYDCDDSLDDNPKCFLFSFLFEPKEE